MTAGTVVITGGIIAAVILLTIVTVLCCCRLQYYCCKSDGSKVEEEEEEEDEPDFAKSLPSSAHQSNSLIPSHSLRPPSPRGPPHILTSPSPLRIISLPEQSLSDQLLTNAELYKPNGPAICRRYSPALSPASIRSYMFCPSCSGLLPFKLPPQQEVRNGGGRISYRSLEQQEVDLPPDISGFNQLNLIRSITLRKMVTHQSISTEV
ncbi:protein FAM163B [Tachysurus vachellii]|uniref:protein FAM163B n=1 Tax=Tachysurus vachellii TaxID=175792 RepID=UPI00296B24ED|nr:protein FAM163B [Tachysurus vachellii]XP_060740245.1 protein FAM163B [Tachysurus vachellii]